MDSDAEAECAPATPNAKLYFPKKETKRVKSVVFQDWVEHDDGDASDQEFTERCRRDDHGKKGVRTEHAKEDQHQERIIAAFRAAKAGELWENRALENLLGRTTLVIRRRLSKYACPMINYIAMVLKVADKLGLNPRMTSEAMTFMTAHGVTEADQKVDLVIDEIKDTVSPFVMEESPSVLSIGKRCAESGYGFRRMPGEEPIMFDDRKSVIRLRVKDNIPYLVTNDETEYEPLVKLTESALGILDYPEKRICLEG